MFDRVAPTAFLARQPIFDDGLHVVGYELLYRSSERNEFDGSDAAQATAATILHYLTTFGIEKLTRGCHAFINIDKETLLNGDVALLPADHVVIELLETIDVDADVVEACQRLVGAGYRIALDDFRPDSSNRRLLPLAEIVKFDFRDSQPQERRSFRAECRGLHLQFLAEKLEDWRDVAAARGEGFGLYQGFFYARPEVVRRPGLNRTKAGALRLMQLMAQPELDLREVEDLFSRELEYSYRLLRYLNSAAFGLTGKVRSIRQALVLLGESGIRRFASLLTMTMLGVGKPQELIVSSVLRGRHCELIAEKAGPGLSTGSCFITGLFSALDALLDQPMDSALEGLALDDQIVSALRGESNRQRAILELAHAHERGDWDRIDAAARQLGIEPKLVAEAYVEALTWAQGLDSDGCEAAAAGTVTPSN